jgi:hypothetical protein
MKRSIDLSFQIVLFISERGGSCPVKSNWLGAKIAPQMVEILRVPREQGSMINAA